MLQRPCWRYSALFSPAVHAGVLSALDGRVRESVIKDSHRQGQPAKALRETRFPKPSPIRHGDTSMSQGTRGLRASSRRPSRHCHPSRGQDRRGHLVSRDLGERLGRLSPRWLVAFDLGGWSSVTEVAVTGPVSWSALSSSSRSVRPERSRARSGGDAAEGSAARAPPEHVSVVK